MSKEPSRAQAEDHAGFFQTADGGTISLDEISETSLAMQVKLLRVLQDREVLMVGSSFPRKVDVRILAASNKDLLSLVKKGCFREDLLPIGRPDTTLAAVARAGDDILLLATHFAMKFARELGRPAPSFSDQALQVLKDYKSPGNVRELENVVQRLVVMNEAEVIDVADLPRLMRFSALREAGLDRSLAEVESQYIRRVSECGWEQHPGRPDSRHRSQNPPRKTGQDDRIFLTSEVQGPTSLGA